MTVPRFAAFSFGKASASVRVVHVREHTFRIASMLKQSRGHPCPNHITSMLESMRFQEHPCPNHSNVHKSIRFSRAWVDAQTAISSISKHTIRTHARTIILSISDISEHTIPRASIVILRVYDSQTMHTQITVTSMPESVRGKQGPPRLRIPKTTKFRVLRKRSLL